LFFSTRFNVLFVFTLFVSSHLALFEKITVCYFSLYFAAISIFEFVRCFASPNSENGGRLYVFVCFFLLGFMLLFVFTFVFTLFFTPYFTFIFSKEQSLFEFKGLLNSCFVKNYPSYPNQI